MGDGVEGSSHGAELDEPVTMVATAVAASATAGRSSGGDGGVVGVVGDGASSGEWWTKSVHWAVSELLKLPTFKANTSRLVGLVRRALDTGRVAVESSSSSSRR
jgi:hypothetical protein